MYRYKEIQNGEVAKSHMRKSFLIYEEMRKFFPIFEEAVRHIWLCNFSILNFLTYEENLILFFISAYFAELMLSSKQQYCHVLIFHTVTTKAIPKSIFS